MCYGPTEAASANMAAPPLSANAGIAIATIRAATDTNIPMRLMLMSAISSPPLLLLSSFGNRLDGSLSVYEQDYGVPSWAAHR